MKSLNNKKFTLTLLEWNSTQNKRTMPWKNEKNPYKIWLSEIILQQTRVEQGLEYYNNFIKKYPDIKKLAAAPDNEVFKLWEGLGYYSRCRNLLFTARYITQQYNGVFPKDYQQILALKGVGPYTAAAIASFAYNQPIAVIDGNVYRVLSRFFGVELPIDSTEGKAYFEKLAASLLPHLQPAAYNQAIMDFGATVCRPALPLCNNCMLQKWCKARLNGNTAALPVKAKKIEVKERWLNFYVLQFKEYICVTLRQNSDIWQNLYCTLSTETMCNSADNEILELFYKKYKMASGNVVKTLVDPLLYNQKLTHRHIKARFVRLWVSKKINIEGYEWIPDNKLKQLAFPKIIKEYLGSQNLTVTAK